MTTPGSTPALDEAAVHAFLERALLASSSSAPPAPQLPDLTILAEG